MMPDLPAVTDALTEEEKQMLLRLAREALVLGVNGRLIPPLDLTGLPPHLQQNGASFVTLTERDELRGCIGTLDPYQPLAEDVREHAVAAALHDYRFPPVRSREVVDITIEISRLTFPQVLAYKDPEELLVRIRPNVDGVVLRDGMRRATFLPQVWEKLPDPASFITYLCQKMGAPGDLWRRRPLQVFTYQVEEFHE